MSLSPSEELKDFPCSFNLQVVNKVSRERFQCVKQKLKEELETDNLSHEEKVRILNLLTWVTFSLVNETDQAVEYNKEALLLTKSRNLTSLCNKIFISFEIEDKVKYEEDLKFVKSLKERSNFEQLKTEALAEQAFSYIKLGLVELHPMSRSLLSYCTDKCPDNYLWKLDLGMVCGRLTQSNFNLTAAGSQTVHELMSTCVEQLMTVGKKAHPRLRSLAYAELACLRQHNSQTQWDHFFNNLSIHDFCEKALNYGRDNPVVLALCGNCLKGDNVDGAIKYLKLSIQLRPTSKACHQLGLCFMKKADTIAQDKGSTSSGTSHRRASANDYARQNRFRNSARPGHRNSKHSLKMYAFANLTPLDKNDILVKEAIQCYEKAIELSFGVNMPARQCLGELYYKTGRYQDALREFNHIINAPDSSVTHIVTLISAHSIAGKCLLMENKIARNYYISQQAKEHFMKTVSLAAGLARKYPEHKNCTTEVWDAYMKLLKDIAEKSRPNKNNIKTIHFQDMAEYADIFKEIESMLSTGLGKGDVEKLKSNLNGCLIDGQYEKALAYINMAMINDTLKQKLGTDTDLLALQSKIYIGTSWSRLLKGSSDFKTSFQQMFEHVYGQCSGIAVGDEAEEELLDRKHDVLIVYSVPSNSQTLANNLLKVMNNLFGVQSSLGLERQTTDTRERNNADLLLQEVVSYRVNLLILNDSDSSSYDETIKAVHSVNGSNVFIINCRQKQPLPRFLETKKRLDLTDAPWSLLKLTEAPQEVVVQENDDIEMSSADIVRELFNGDVESVVKLFCFIVDEEFENHRENFKLKH